LPSVAFAPSLPGVGAAFGGRCELLGGGLSGQALFGDRDALLDDWADFLGLFDRRDDPTRNLRLVRLEFAVLSFGQKNSGR
jgi:hypothetical protein